MRAVVLSQKKKTILVVLDKIGALLRHGDEGRYVVVHQGLLEGRQLAESVDLADAVLAQCALKHNKRQGV